MKLISILMTLILATPVLAADADTCAKLADTVKHTQNEFDQAMLAVYGAAIVCENEGDRSECEAKLVALFEETGAHLDAALKAYKQAGCAELAKVPPQPPILKARAWRCVANGTDAEGNLQYGNWASSATRSQAERKAISSCSKIAVGCSIAQCYQ